MSHDGLKKLIESIVERQMMISEQEPGESDTEMPDFSDVGLDLDSEDLGGGDDGPLGNIESDSSLDDIDAGGGDSGGLDLDGGDDLGDDVPDMGGSGGGGGFSGGGGGFDFGGDDIDTEDSAPDETSPPGESKSDTHEPGESLLPDDPTQEAIDMAIDMLDQTGDPQIILNAVKSNIQKQFEDPDEALGIIQGLWETEDPILRVVARKLILFIKGK